MFSAVFAAGGLTNASATLSDPRPDAPAASVTYGLSWKANTSATLKCFTYRWSTSPNAGQGSVPGGFSNSSATNGSFTGLTTSNWTISNSVAGTVKNTYTTGESVASGAQVTTPIQLLTNPTAPGGGSYYIEINTYTDTSCSALVDTAVIGFVTVPSVLVSATIDSTLSFAVTGLAPAAAIKSGLTVDAKCGDTSTGITYGSPTLPLSADTTYDCAQNLATSTNSNGGYQVTVQGKQSGTDFLALVSDDTKTISNSSGTNTTPVATAATPAETFGYTTNDSTLSGVANRFTTASDLFAGLTTTPDQIAYNATAIANDQVNVGYRLKFTGTTEAGAYRGTLVYTCTPVF